MATTTPPSKRPAAKKPAAKKPAAKKPAAKKPAAKKPAAKKPAAKKPAAKKSRLTRAKNAMPSNVRSALSARGLTRAFHERPDFQQNDYLGWIARAKREETRSARLEQMLDELARGGVYMKMRWSPARARTS